MFGSILRLSALGLLAAALLTACGKGTPLTSGTATPAPPYQPSVTSEYTVPTASSHPMGIAVTTADNSLWFTENAPSKLGDLLTTGTISTPEPLTPSKNAGPNQIASGPNSNMWFTESNVGKVGQITLLTTNPVVTEFLLSANARPTAIALGPDGNMWMTDPGTNSVWKVSQTGVVGTPCSLSGNAQPTSITADSNDGAVWFTEAGTNRIGRLPVTGSASCGAVAEFNVPKHGGNTGLVAIVTGQDNALWFLEQRAKMLGRMDVTGKVTNLYPLSPAVSPDSLIQGIDNNFYFADPGSNQIGRVVVTTKKVTVTMYKIPTAGAMPGAMTLGPDNQIYFVETHGNHIGQFKYFCC